MLPALPLITSAVSSLLSSSAVQPAVQSVTKATTPAAAAGSDFSSVMAQLANGTIEKLNNSETMSVAGITGKASTQSVVEAVVAAQESLQTAVAVRDKAVSAFQEVTRMSI